jgi:hypothetical protein
MIIKTKFNMNDVVYVIAKKNLELQMFGGKITQIRLEIYRGRKNRAVKEIDYNIETEEGNFYNISQKNIFKTFKACEKQLKELQKARKVANKFDFEFQLR